MSKGLKAFRRIKEHTLSYGGSVYKESTNSREEQIKDLDAIEQELKALEIIKREPSDVIETITTYDTWEEYIKDYPISDKTILHFIKNKSEFDLLKEVLCE